MKSLREIGDIPGARVVLLVVHIFLEDKEEYHGDVLQKVVFPESSAKGSF